MNNYRVSKDYFDENSINRSKILLLMNNDRNAELLNKFLSNKYFTFSSYENTEKYDLIMVDKHYYQIKFSMLNKLKKEQEPLFLPLILMHKREDTIDYTSKMMNIADEYILTPVKKDELIGRIKILLRTRNLTKIIYSLNNNYQKIFNNINDMIFLHKINFSERSFSNFIEVNEKLVEKLNYDKSELLNMKPTDLINQELKSRFFSHYINKLEQDGEIIVETKILTKNKELIPVEINSKIITLEDDDWVLSVLRDIKHRGS